MPVESPCNAVCTLDALGRMCVGCLRTAKEISAWPTLSDAERLEVLRAIDARRVQLQSEGWTCERCAQCGAEFTCAAGDPNCTCWCLRFPAVTPSCAGARCLCPACLASAAT